MTNAEHQSHTRTDLRFRDVNQHAGQFAGLRFYRADGKWIIDGERADSTLGEQYAYASPTRALNEMPILFAILVLGVTIEMVRMPSREDQDEAPAEWRVYLPIVGGGTEASQWRGRLAAENFVRSWMRSL